ncbi:MAG: hypothetical protein L0338_21695 [Acidobacteria bacterium]|nr:hypothetical protein [Acidobacteriota bacterium]
MIDAELLLRILHRIDQLSERPAGSPAKRITTESFVDLVIPAQPRAEAWGQVNRHLEFLAQEGLISTAGQEAFSEKYHGISMTAKGQVYLQPELAQFTGPVWGQVVTIIEQHIHEAPVPREQKQSWIHKLREAVADQSAQLVTQVIFEILRTGLLR